MNGPRASVGLRHLELLQPRGYHLGEAPRSGPAPVEAPDERAVHEHVVALGDPLQGALADVAMPRGDRQGEALPASGTESRISVSPDTVKGA